MPQSGIFSLTIYYSIVTNKLVIPKLPIFTSILHSLGQLGNRAALTFFSNSLSLGIDFHKAQTPYFLLRRPS
jgi:hypothetical protein